MHVSNDMQVIRVNKTNANLRTTGPITDFDGNEIKPISSEDKLLIYGSLLPGMHNHHMTKGMKWEDDIITLDGYKMHSVQGSYPIIEKTGNGDTITGLIVNVAGRVEAAHNILMMELHSGYTVDEIQVHGKPVKVFIAATSYLPRVMKLSTPVPDGNWVQFKKAQSTAV